MKTLLKVLGLFAAGAIVIFASLWIIGMVAAIVKLAFWVAVIAAIGFVVLKAFSMMGGGSQQAAAPPSLSEAKTEESRTLAPGEKKAMSDAEALRLFEEAKRKNTEGHS